MGVYMKHGSTIIEVTPEEKQTSHHNQLMTNDELMDENSRKISKPIMEIGTPYERRRSTGNVLTTNYSQATLSDISSDGIWNNGYHQTSQPSPEMKISHAMVIACSALYCVKLTAIGLAFPLAYLIMFNTDEGFGAAIYRGYPIYLYTVGIIFQVFYLSKQCCFKGEDELPDIKEELRSFGSKGYRVLTALCGIVSAVWFLILFSWILDVYSIHGADCTERNLEAASCALAFVYTMLHIVVGFYNTKLLATGSSVVVLFGMMHMIGTNLSTWGWTAAHFTVLTVLNIQPNVSSHLDCEMTSPLGSFIYDSHSYFGIFVLIYFLVSSALLFAAFAHHYEEGTFYVASKLDEKYKSLLKNNISWKVSVPGFTIGAVILALSIIFIIFHYILIIRWNSPDKSFLSMEVVSIVLKLLAILCTVILLWVQNRAKDPIMNRRILFESIVLVVSLFMLYICDVCYAISNLREGGYLNNWSGAHVIIEICETTLQTTFLLSAMKYNAKLVPAKYYSLDKCCVVYLMIHNVIIAVFTFMRQYDYVYGYTYVTLFGIWFWAVFKFWVNAFVVLYRLYSTVFLGSLWLRCLKNE